MDWLQVYRRWSDRFDGSGVWDHVEGDDRLSIKAVAVNHNKRHLDEQPTKQRLGAINRIGWAWEERKQVGWTPKG